MTVALELRATSWLRRIGIRYRLIVSFILLPLLPLLVSGYISYAESSKAIQEKARVFSTEIVKQVAKNVRLQMAAIEADSEALVLSERVQTALAHYGGENQADKGRARNEMSTILLDTYGSFEHINQKYFLDKDQRVMDTQVFAQLGRGLVSFAERAPRLKGRPYWNTLDIWTGQKNIVMLRDIYFKDNNRLAGSLLLGVRQAHFGAVFDDVDLGKGSEVYILDAGNGSIIMRSRERSALAGGNLANRALVEAIAQAARQGQGSGFVSYAESEYSRYLAAFAAIPGTGWFVVNAIPANRLLAEAQSARDQIVLIGLLCFVLSVALAYLIWRSISTPLEQLVGLMQQAQAGNYASRARQEGSDELTLLAQQFNAMAGQIGQHHEQMEARVAERTRDLEEANSKLAALSLSDALTGIANRRCFDEALVTELNRAARSRRPLALMMIDVDFFKNYNDFYGHQEGDACLRKVARLLETHARRASDLVARYGGEEFVMLAADTDLETALALAEAIRQSLEALALPHEKSPIGWVTTSIGVAALGPDDQQSPEMFLRMADKAMYRAKEQGRNRVVAAGRK